MKKSMRVITPFLRESWQSLSKRILANCILVLGLVGCFGLGGCEGTGIETIDGVLPFTPTDSAEAVTPAPGPIASERECASNKSEWIFCDDFEIDRTSKYFEYDDANKSFTRVKSVGMDNSYGMKASFSKGQINAGTLKLAFGKTPSAYIKPAANDGKIYQEIYWRMFVRYDADWIGGGGDKLSRAQSLANASWAQAMMAPIWSGTGDNKSFLTIDPATGIAGTGILLVTKYNDFVNQRWLGMVKGKTPIFQGNNLGKWHCVEGYVKLNSADSTNGVFSLWVNGNLEATKDDLNWVGKYREYGINAVFLENYWNDGSPRAQSRYFDRFVVSTTRIGC